MHLVVALDGPVAFSHPNPINQPKPGSQEQLRVLPSHHLRARDVPSSSQGRNWEEKSFTFSLRELWKRSLDFGFLREGGKEYSEVERGVEWLEERKKTGWKQVFLRVLTEIIVSILHQMKTSDQRHPEVGFGAVCGFSCVFMGYFFSKPVSFLPLVY